MTATLSMLLPCYVVEPVAAILAKYQGETPAARAISHMGEIITIYSNPKTGTYTVVVETPAKAKCIVSTGTDFEILKQGDAI